MTIVEWKRARQQKSKFELFAWLTYLQRAEPLGVRFDFLVERLFDLFVCLFVRVNERGSKFIHFSLVKSSAPATSRLLEWAQSSSAPS